MCTGGEIAAVAGTAAQQYGDAQTRRDQQHEVERRAEQARQLNERAGARVSQEVDKLKSSTDEAAKLEENKLQGDFMEALRRAQIANGGSGGLSDAENGAVSDTFRADAATARNANVAGNRAAVNSLSRIDAPFMQRVREATGGSRLRSDLSRVAQEGEGQDFLSQLRLSLISPNAGLNAAGQFANAYGQASSQRMLPAKRPYGGAPRTVDSTIPGGG